MSKLEEIKETCNDLTNGLYTEIYPSTYLSDVTHLLSLIEQADKALGRISDLHIRGIEDRAAEPHRAIVKAALQAIRGSE